MKTLRISHCESTFTTPTGGPSGLVRYNNVFHNSKLLLRSDDWSTPAFHQTAPDCFLQRLRVPLMPAIPHMPWTLLDTGDQAWGLCIPALLWTIFIEIVIPARILGHNYLIILNNNEKLLKGLERWLRGQEHLLLGHGFSLQGTYTVTHNYKSSSNCKSSSRHPAPSSGICRHQTYMCKCVVWHSYT